MIELSDYKPVTLEDKKIFDKHYERYPQFHSEYMFTGFVAWSHYMPAYYFLKEDMLYIMSLKEGRPQFRMPIGRQNNSAIKDVLAIAEKEGAKRPVIAITENEKQQVLSCCPKAEIKEDRDFFDYVYQSKDLAELKGKHYMSNRNQLKQFNKKFKYSVEEITDKNMGDADQFLHRWCLWRDCESQPMLLEERTAILFCMKHFQKLGLSGLAIRIEGELQAISVHEELNKETAVIHFEKAMPDYEGLYQAINNETAKKLAEKYKYINRESDLGIEGLRTAKMRLNPHHMEKLYYVKKEDLFIQV